MCAIQVKRKEPQELGEGGELKRARPSTPPDEEDEGTLQIQCFKIDLLTCISKSSVLMFT